MAKFGLFRKSAADARPAGEESVFVALSPFRIEPLFDKRVWGFRDLRPWYDHVVAEGQDPIGEVWLTGDKCRVATGPHTGKLLEALFQEQPEALLGADAESAGSPLLIKVLFAREKLSVQVHPDDAMAQKYGEPRGKTECWYVLNADKGAELALGLKPGVTMDAVRSGIQNGTLEESLNLVPIVNDDMVFVDAGTVHAIWPGSVLLETQQYSDTTYRMYDYGRPRELHIEKSIEATRVKTRAGKIPPQVLADRTVLIAVEYFRVERLAVSSSRTSATLHASDEPAHGLSYLFAANGSARVSGEGFEAFEIPTRGIAAIPAASPEFVVEDLGGLDLIRVAPSWPKPKSNPEQKA
jgi:mannose-6-phosphate isomerase